MSLKISTSTAATFAALGIEDGIRALAAGFDAMDFGFDAFIPYNDLKSGKSDTVFGKSREDIVSYFAGLYNVAKEAGIEIGQTHAPFPSYIAGAEDSANDFILEVIKKSIYATAAMGCRHIVVHPAFGQDYYNRMSPKEELDLNYKLYQALIPTLKETGVVCCLENMYIYATFQRKGIGAAFSMPYFVNTFIDRMNDEAGAELFAYCIDVGHALLIGSDPEYFIAAVGERIKTVHLHDIYNNYDDHTAPFLGIMPWDRVLRGLHDIGYTGILNLETGTFIQKNGKESTISSINILANAARRLRTMFDEIENGTDEE